MNFQSSSTSYLPPCFLLHFQTPVVLHYFLICHPHPRIFTVLELPSVLSSYSTLYAFLPYFPSTILMSPIFSLFSPCPRSVLLEVSFPAGPVVLSVYIYFPNVYMSSKSFIILIFKPFSAFRQTSLRTFSISLLFPIRSCPYPVVVMFLISATFLVLCTFPIMLLTVYCSLSIF